MMPVALCEECRRSAENELLRMRYIDCITCSGVFFVYIFIWRCVVTHKSEKEKYLAWYESEKENGLLDVKFFPGEGIGRDTTSEDFFAEANRVNELYAQKAFVERLDVM